MGMQINTNMAALNASRVLNRTSNALNQSMERLSSGLRINRAADDAAGLTIAEKFNSTVKGTAMAQRNAQDGINMVQTMEGDLSEITNILQRMRELAVQASTGTQDDKSLEALHNEVNELVGQIEDIANSSQFNGINLLNRWDDTDGAESITLQVGSRNDDNQRLDVTLHDMTAMEAYDSDNGLAINVVDAIGDNNNDHEISLKSSEDAQTSIGRIDSALDAVNEARSELGATQNRLGFIMNTLAIEQENAASSQSAIRDADMAQESMNFTRNQILQQAGTSMLAQANMIPQTALQLLG